MLRNIPNKLNQKELKKIVDSSSFGSYDFMYLRIDFSNNCKYVDDASPVTDTQSLTSHSVGYAFINFTDPLDIIRVRPRGPYQIEKVLTMVKFVEARSNKKWEKSDKVAEVSYASKLAQSHSRDL